MPSGASAIIRDAMPIFRTEDPYLTPLGAWAFFGGVAVWVALFTAMLIDVVL